MSYLKLFVLLSTVLIISSCDDKTVQPPTTGIIKGVVKDINGGRVRGAIVNTLPPTSSVTTDSIGEYIISDVKDGDYTVTGSHPDYGNTTIPIRMTSGKIIQGDMILPLKNLPPSTPIIENPLMNQRILIGNVDISWNCSDPDGDVIQYYLLMSKTQPFTENDTLLKNVVVKQYSTITTDTGNYYCQVIAKDVRGAISQSQIVKFMIYEDIIPETDYAMQFDGMSTFGVIPTSSLLHLSKGEYTIETWINMEQFTGDWQMFFARDNTNDNNDYLFFIDRNSRRFKMFSRNLSITLDGKSDVIPNTWYHLALVQSNDGFVKLYVNGLLEASTTISGSVIDPRVPLRIGCRTNDITNGLPDNVFRGMMDETRIWNIARTENEIRANFRKRISATTPGLILYLNYNEGTGSI
ncbi:MAG: hypothetical protein JNL32_11000, partial [Candidatus Kapabacteria bacterium]|nr:hypothetical protein [Candidatus Kapabacteria bacterium]